MPTGETDVAGRVSTFAPSGLYRKVETTYTSGTGGTMTESFAYDAGNNLTQFVDSTGTTSRTFDDMGRFTSETKGTNTVSHKYDGTSTATTGRLVSITDAAGRTVSHTYTVRGQLVTVGDGAGVASYTYGTAGEELTTTNANGTTVTKTYDDAGRLASLTNKSAGSTVLSSFAYTYRADGKKGSVTENTGAVVSYTYDDAGRLVGEGRTGAASFSKTYTLDADGNRLVQPSAGYPFTFAYDTDDALTSVSFSAAGVYNSYTYNVAGDQITRSYQRGGGTPTTYNLSYNSKGELSGITGGSGTAKAFAYDAQGRRVSRTAGGVTTTFLRAGDANDGVVINEKQGTTLTASYTYGNGLLAKGSESYLFDGQGSTRQTTDTTGTVTSSNTSDAFGNTVASSGTKPEYGYGAQSGYRDDGDAGLVHIGARYYDPQVGLFTTRDTYLSEKPYQYCDNDPVNYNDPSGHKPNEFLMSIGYVFLGLAFTAVVAALTIIATVTITAVVAASVVAIDVLAVVAIVAAIVLITKGATSP